MRLGTLVSGIAALVFALGGRQRGRTLPPPPPMLLPESSGLASHFTSRCDSLWFLARASDEPDTQAADTITSANVENLQITSKIFNNTRTIRILLPPHYHEPENALRRYPVLYFTDGITVFKSRTFELEQRIYPLIQNGSLPALIVVGVDNGGSTDKSKNPETDRANEFLPYPDVGFPPSHLYAPDPPHPQGRLYPDFLVTEVMPLIQQRYRIKTGPSNTVLGGFSYGGVGALYTVISKPGTFGGLLLESTPLWVGPDRQLLTDAEHTRVWPQAVYVGLGTKETDQEDVGREGKQDEERLLAIIRKNSPKTRLKSVLEEGGIHDASSWGRRLPVALEFLFGRS
jgi:predicted alpha/beta superfamily hydrolase